MHSLFQAHRIKNQSSKVREVHLAVDESPDVGERVTI
jgi:hypothetical protein